MNTNTSASADAERLIDLLRQQNELYEKLRGLSQRQRSLISSERPEMLLELLRDRQSLVMGLARVNEQLSPYRRDWESTYSRLDGPAREAVGSLLAGINSTLQAILRADREDGALLAARKRAVGRAMDEVADNRAANVAYAAQPNRVGSGQADVTG